MLTKPSDDADWSVTVSVLGERIMALPKAEYPPSEVRSARSSQVGSVDEHIPIELSAREMSQVLRDVTWMRRSMSKVDACSWDGIYAGHFTCVSMARICR